MSIFCFQNLTLDLYTNANIRNSFLKDPESVFCKHSLTEREKKALRQLPENLLESFSHSLIMKKQEMVQKILSRNPASVIISSWHTASPAIYFLNKASGKVEEVEISNNIFHILKSLEEKISPWRVTRCCFRMKNLNLDKAVQTIRFINDKNLWGQPLLIR